MGSKVVQLASQGDVRFFQEVHCMEGEVSKLFGSLLPDWRILVSAPQSTDECIFAGQEVW